MTLKERKPMQLTPYEINDIHNRKVAEVMNYNAHLREADRLDTPKQRKTVYQTLLTLIVRAVHS